MYLCVCSSSASCLTSLWPPFYSSVNCNNDNSNNNKRYFRAVLQEKWVVTYKMLRTLPGRKCSKRLADTFFSNKNCLKWIKNSYLVACHIASISWTHECIYTMRNLGVQWHRTLQCVWKSKVKHLKFILMSRILESDIMEQHIVILLGYSWS